MKSLDDTMLYLMNEAAEDELFAVACSVPVAGGEPLNVDFLLLVEDVRDVFDAWTEDDEQSLQNVYDGVMTALNDGAEAKTLATGSDEDKDTFVTDMKLGVLLRMYFGAQVDQHLPFTFDLMLNPEKNMDPARFAVLVRQVEEMNESVN